MVLFISQENHTPPSTTPHPYIHPSLSHPSFLALSYDAKMLLRTFDAWQQWNWMDTTALRRRLDYTQTGTGN